jgi:hypothetical protein
MNTEQQEINEKELESMVGTFAIPLAAYVAYEQNQAHAKALANLAVKPIPPNATRRERAHIEKENKENIKAITKNGKNLFAKCKKLVDQMDLLNGNNGAVFQKMVERTHTFLENLIKWEFYGVETFVPKKKPIMKAMKPELEKVLTNMQIYNSREENGAIVWEFEGEEYELNVIKR